MENLGLRDTAGLALGEHFSLKTAGVGDCNSEEEVKKGAPLLYRRNAQSVSDAEQYLIRSKSV